MVFGSVKEARAGDEFDRLHRLFVEHFALAVGFVWVTALYAAMHAPWVRNIRGLIDPTGRPESTTSFLFGLPLMMTGALLCAAFGAGLIRRSQLLKNQALEFGLAGVIVFAVFCMAIHRAVVVHQLG